MTGSPARADGSSKWRWRIGVAMFPLLLLLLAAGGWYWWSTRPTAALAGQVVGAEAKNQPVAGAEVRILGIPRVVRTDPQGRFELRWLPAGSMQIKVTAAGYETQVVAAETVHGVTTAVAIVLAASHPAVKAEPTTAIKGEVVVDACEERKPVSGATIRLAGTNKTVEFRVAGTKALATLATLLGLLGLEVVHESAVIPSLVRDSAPDDTERQRWLATAERPQDAVLAEIANISHVSVLHSQPIRSA
jgi:hypothetical protein